MLINEQSLASLKTKSILQEGKTDRSEGLSKLNLKTIKTDPNSNSVNRLQEEPVASIGTIIGATITLKC